MRLKHKKLLISGIAVTTAGALAAGALLQSGVSVLASPVMMPGIEKIVNETTAAAPFRILEIVNDTKEAEIGYYVSGQEPHIKLYEYQAKDNNGNVTDTIHFSDLEEGLSKLPAEKREEFVRNVLLDEEGKVVRTGVTAKDIFQYCYRDGSEGNERDDYPLSYRDYIETYFLTEDAEGWKRIDFTDLDGKPRMDEVKLWGKYVENTAGTGDYTKQKQFYYPIRQDVDKDHDPEVHEEYFRENIVNFAYNDGSGATAPYNLKFEEVRNEDVNEALAALKEGNQENNLILQEYDYKNNHRYGFYENVYVNLTEERIANRMKIPGETLDESEEGIVVSANASLNAAEVFSADDDSPFSSDQKDAFEEEKEPQPVIEEVLDAPEAFSDGSFGDGFSEAFSDTEGLVEIPQEPMTESEPITETEPVIETDPTVEGQPGDGEAPEEPTDPDQRKILLDVIGENAGTQDDPYIYYGTEMDGYPHYKYQCVSDLDGILKQKVLTDVKDAAATANKEPIVRADKDVTLESGQYFYWYEEKKTDEETGVETSEIKQVPLSIVAGRQPVALKDIRPIKMKTDEEDDGIDYNYYYRVSEVTFCCKFSETETDVNPEDKPEKPYETPQDNPKCFEYFGWYYPLYPEKEDRYLPVSPEKEEVATHYITEPIYKLTEGTGDHDFVLGKEGDEGVKEWLVEVNHMFYRGGFTNHDWLKRFVFHLNPEDEDFADFGIEVTTMTVEEFETEFGSGADVAAGFSDFSEVEGPVTFDSGSAETEGQDAGIGDTEASAAEFTDFQSEPLPKEGEASPVEMMISESREAGETEALFLDTAELESVEEEPVFSDEKALPVEVEKAEKEPALEAVFDSELPAAFADTGETPELPALEDFDLIYINGRMNDAGADMLATSKIPCIINQEKADTTSPLYQAFWKEGFVKTEDEDGHYVSQYVYFFKNSFLSVDTPPEGLENENVFDFVNCQFHKNFNLNPDGGNTGEDAQAAAVEGFEEILEYIEQENQYRELGRKDEISDGEEPDKSYLLTYELSQARAVEYILNYKLRRIILHEGVVRVLEIQPARSEGQITKEKLGEWFGLPWLSEPVVSDGSGGWMQCEIHGETSAIRMIECLAEPAADGTATKYRIQFLDKGGTVLSEESGELPYGGGTERQTIDLATPVPEQAVTLKFFFGTEDSPVSCKELGVCTGTSFEITTMTSSEFVGHIEDINTRYDMIYLGNDASDLAYESNFRPADKILYYHVGDANASGSGRGSGNDITENIKNRLVNFAKSGYPVVAANGIYEQGKEVSTELVDNSSYIYDFLNEIRGYRNVYREEDVEKSGTIDFFEKLPKPKIVLDETPPSIIGNEGGTSIDFLTEEDLTFRFRIEDQINASPADASYHCELFLDMNCDGNFSAAEGLNDIVVMQNDEVVSAAMDGQYQLSLETTYTVSRKIPMEYIKLIPWKLVVTNNLNPEICASEIGYTKRQAGEDAKENNVIEVLQIMSESGGNWRLEGDSGFMALFDAVHTDFQLEITSVTLGQYQTEYQENPSYLDAYDLLIVGFGYDEKVAGFSEKGMQGLRDFADTGKSIIFSHDSIRGAEALRAAFGMDRYLFDTAYTLNSGKTVSYAETQGLTSTNLSWSDLNSENSESIATNQVSKLNEGAITEYPYKIDDSFAIADSHAQAYQLAMEEDADKDSSNDLVVWYTLGDETGEDIYSHMPKDVRNNYYLYSYKNVIYTGIGHSGEITEMEKKLFVNTIIAAYNAQAVDLNLAFVESSDWEARELTSVYYMLDNLNFSDAQELLSDSQEFHLRVTDSNLYGRLIESIDPENLKLELFMESDSADAKQEPGIGDIDTWVQKIDLTAVPVLWKGEPLQPEEVDGETAIYLCSGKVYDFTLYNLSDWLADTQGGYKGKVTLFARISCNYLYYGEVKTAQTVAQITLRQRQLFDMD